MKPKQAFIMLAAVSALVGLIVVYEYVIVPNREKAKSQEELFFPDFDESAVNNITIADGGTSGKSVTLVRGGDSVWQVESKGGYPADKDAVSKLLDAFKEIKKGTMSSESSSSHERLGVDEAHGKRVTVKSGASIAADLIVGNQGKSYGTYFARVPGEDEVYLVLEDLKGLTSGNGGEWRDKKILNEELDKVAEISLTVFPGATAAPSTGDTASPASAPKAPVVTVLKHDPAGKTWTLVGDGGTAESIDTSKADGLARSLCTLTAVAFADTATPTSAGLDPPAKKAELKTTDGKSYTLLVGREEQSKFYVKRADRDVIQQVYKYNISGIFKTPSELMTSPEGPGSGGFDPTNMLPPPDLNKGGGDFHELMNGFTAEVPAEPPSDPPDMDGAPDTGEPPGSGDEMATPPSLHAPPPGAPPEPPRASP